MLKLSSHSNFTFFQCCLQVCLGLGTETTLLGFGKDNNWVEFHGFVTTNTMETTSCCLEICCSAVVLRSSLLAVVPPPSRPLKTNSTHVNWKADTYCRDDVIHESDANDLFCRLGRTSYTTKSTVTMEKSTESKCVSVCHRRHIREETRPVNKWSVNNETHTHAQTSWTSRGSCRPFFIST